jgi:hypothetical protein
MPVGEIRGSTSTSLSEQILAAIRAEIARRKDVIDSGRGSLVSVAIEVKLQDTADPIRSVIFTDQSVRARRS